MCYLHYFETKSTPNEQQINNFIGAVNAIINYTFVPLSGPIDDAPLVTEDRITFNGVEGDAHETFDLNLTELKWSFCKTAAKPYDEVVVAVLLAAEKELGSTFTWSSDGEGEDFKEGKELYEEAIHYDGYF